MPRHNPQPACPHCWYTGWIFASPKTNAHCWRAQAQPHTPGLIVRSACMQGNQKQAIHPEQGPSHHDMHTSTARHGVTRIKLMSSADAASCCQANKLQALQVAQQKCTPWLMSKCQEGAVVQLSKITPATLCWLHAGRPTGVTCMGDAPRAHAFCAHRILSIACRQTNHNHPHTQVDTQTARTKGQCKRISMTAQGEGTSTPTPITPTHHGTTAAGLLSQGQQPHTEMRAHLARHCSRSSRCRLQTHAEQSKMRQSPNQTAGESGLQVISCMLEPCWSSWCDLCTHEMGRCLGAACTTPQLHLIAQAQVKSTTPITASHTCQDVQNPRPPPSNPHTLAP